MVSIINKTLSMLVSFVSTHNKTLITAAWRHLLQLDLKCYHLINTLEVV